MSDFDRTYPAQPTVETWAFRDNNVHVLLEDDLNSAG